MTSFGPISGLLAQWRSGHGRKHRHLLLATIGAISGLAPKPAIAQNPLGFDSFAPESIVPLIESLDLTTANTGWLRIREMGPGPRVAPETANQTLPTPVATRWAALETIRRRSIHTVAMLHWPPKAWSSGVRPAPSELPLDLTEAYRRCRDLAYTYGDLIDAWEIENEPDIDFVRENAETFAAFYKACALGIIHGRAENAAEQSKGLNVKSLNVGENEPPGTDQQDIGQADGDDLQTFGPSDLQTVHDRAASAIMHSPLALPPGPYWNELVANDVLSYTEAFNYHYYGYAEDFIGVRDAWIAALEEAFDQRGSLKYQVLKSKSQDEKDANSGNAELQLGPTSPNATRQDKTSEHSPTVTPPHRLTGKPPPGARAHPQTRPSDLGHSDFRIASAQPMLPVFLTEYGYGLLDRFDRFTAEGRERQAEWYREVLPAITDGTIIGAMAFYMPPWLGPAGQNEFGLLAATEATDRTIKVFSTQSRQDATAPGLAASPAEAVGTQKKLRAFTPPRLCVKGISPVVIDFVAGQDTQSVKRYNGHLLRSVIQGETTSVSSASEPSPAGTQPPAPASVSSGDFSLVLYNFSNQPVTGTLIVTLEHGTLTAPDSEPTAHSSQLTAHHEEPTANSLPPTAQSAPLKAPPPPPYVRPDTPRSSLRPPSNSNWPNAGTRFIATTDGKTYAISPALAVLMENAEKLKNTSPQPSALSSELTAQPQSLRPLPLCVPALKSPPQHLPPPALSSARSPLCVKQDLTLAPMERREIKLTATLPNKEFRGHRLNAVWEETEAMSNQLPANSSKPITQGSQLQAYSSELSVLSSQLTAPSSQLQTHPPVAGLRSASRLATQLYPAPSAFRTTIIDGFTFSAETNVTARAQQLARPRAAEEAQLAERASAPRWLSTPGVEIEETFTGWRITVNDLPAESLRPAEVELPLPNDWAFPSDAALSFKYRLVLAPETKPHPNATVAGLAEAGPGATTPAATTAPESGPSQPSPYPDRPDAATRANRYEEFEINFRDANGTLWGVWPHLFAKILPQNYLEPAPNFTPMFFSRAPVRRAQSLELKADSSELKADSSPFKAKSLVILFRPRVLPTTIEIDFPRLIRLEPR